MVKIKRILGIIVFLALIIVLLSVSPSGCRSLPPEVSIADIKANPEAYYGETVVVSGEYQGWSGECGSPPVTRSDWVIADETGCIYVTGKSSGLDPVKDRGKAITVVGKVSESNTQVYLRAEIVRIGGE